MAKKMEEGLVIKYEIMSTQKDKEKSSIAKRALDEARARKLQESLAKEINGPKGLEPTRYGDWEAKGRCYDF